MPAFLIADIRVINRDKYDEYRRLFRACVKRHHGRFLARGQEPEIVQGGWHPPRILLCEFDQRTDVDALVASAEYRELEVMRGNCGMFDIVVVDGIAKSRFAGRGAHPVYAIADTRIINRSAFEEHRTRIDRGVREHKGRYLALNDTITTIAGNWAPTFLSIMEFPSRAQAMAAHTASGYQELRDLVNNIAMIDMVLLSGQAPDAPA